jgi:hypothetical protein
MATEILPRHPESSRHIDISTALSGLNPLRLVRFFRKVHVAESSGLIGNMRLQTGISPKTMAQLKETDAIFKRLDGKEPGIYTGNSRF